MKLVLPRSRFAAVSLLGVSFLGIPVLAATDQPAPAELVREAVQNEIASNTNSGAHFMFKDRRQTVHISQTKLIVETRDATAGMVIVQDGHPLTPEQRKAEEARLENYIRNPEELNKKRKQEKEDAEHTERILRALPDAFLYQPDGTQPGSESVGRNGDQLLRLKFSPNPNYSPPSRVEQVLTGMVGHLLIDTREKRIAEIDGALQKDVGFGWGILGHLDRGGRFLVRQADVGGQQWELTTMELTFTGKVLFFKKLNIHSQDVFSDFHSVPPDLTFAQGVEMLRKAAGSSSVQESKPQTDKRIEESSNAQSSNRHN